MKYLFSVLLVTVSFILLVSCKESAVEPEEQFVQVHFKYGFKNELNTFENIYQKDLIEDGTAQRDFWLTAEEQNNILTKANETGYFSMPDKFEYTSDDGTAVTIDPNPGEQKFRIRHKETDKTVTWTYPVASGNPQFNKLTELADYIKSVIEAKSEYKNLPPARGSYL